MTDLPMLLACIDDTKKPDEIPQDKWLEYGKIYTLINVQFLDSSNTMGFELDEITLDKSCFPYHYFTPNRFVPTSTKEQEQITNAVEDLINPTRA
tara:strand:+ start:235 stop:519 length:285 start_codon:yes stop_codon:yes gene_type:complete